MLVKSSRTDNNGFVNDNGRMKRIMKRKDNNLDNKSYHSPFSGCGGGAVFREFSANQKPAHVFACDRKLGVILIILNALPIAFFLLL